MNNEKNDFKVNKNSASSAKRSSMFLRQNRTRKVSFDPTILINFKPVRMVSLYVIYG